MEVIVSCERSDTLGVGLHRNEAVCSPGKIVVYMRWTLEGLARRLRARGLIPGSDKLGPEDEE